MCGEFTGLADQMRETVLSQPHLFALDAWAVAHQNSFPVLNQNLKGFCGALCVNYEEIHLTGLSRGKDRAVRDEVNASMQVSHGELFNALIRTTFFQAPPGRPSEVLRPRHDTYFTVSVESQTPAISLTAR